MKFEYIRMVHLLQYPNFLKNKFLEMFAFELIQRYNFNGDNLI